MISVIENMLAETQLRRIRDTLSRAEFQDGKLSAGITAQSIKSNSELVTDSPEFNALNNIVMGSLVKHPEYRAICWPKRIASPIYARYEPGMSYGMHVDDPVMGSSPAYRSDISLTIFLSAKDDYEGGELIIGHNHAQQTIKLDAGSVVFYPSSSLHAVAPVTKGTRLVAVSWVQSSIRRADRRATLFELNQAREILIKDHPHSEACQKVCNSFNNLVRDWVEL